MPLSITGNILTGPFLRPDITEPTHQKVLKSEPTHQTSLEVYEPDGECCIEVTSKSVPAQKITISGLKLNWLNKCGMIPGVSTVTGLGRSFLGLLHTIVHLAKAIFDTKNRREHLSEAALGFYNLGRGIVEAIPVLGNSLVIIFDLCRLEKQEKAYAARMRDLSSI